jgi:hypothetical protein
MFVPIIPVARTFRPRARGASRLSLCRLRGEREGETPSPPVAHHFWLTIEMPAMRRDYDDMAVAVAGVVLGTTRWAIVAMSSLELTGLVRWAW